MDVAKPRARGAKVPMIYKPVRKRVLLGYGGKLRTEKHSSVL
jgi:hypothetical protein